MGAVRAQRRRLHRRGPTASAVEGGGEPRQLRVARRVRRRSRSPGSSTRRKDPSLAVKTLQAVLGVARSRTRRTMNEINSLFGCRELRGASVQRTTMRSSRQRSHLVVGVARRRGHRARGGRALRARKPFAVVPCCVFASSAVGRRRDSQTAPQCSRPRSSWTTSRRRAPSSVAVLDFEGRSESLLHALPRRGRRRARAEPAVGYHCGGWLSHQTLATYCDCKRKLVQTRTSIARACVAALLRLS